MSVTSYDGSFSFKQDSLARLGERAANRPGMSPQDYEAFQNSPFMQSMRKIEELTFHKMSMRDKKRAATDPSFKPSDEDFEANKAHKYDKAMNYYKTLGVDEYIPQKGVKDAYKRLSLVYHPDKTAGLPSEVKDEYAVIFIELKNAYQTLSDNSTRRQYDRDRDKDQAAAELNGWKVKERAQFDATEVLRKLQEEAVAKKPSKTVEIDMRCRLEKFYYGGHKAVARKRRVKTKMGFQEEERTYRIDVPAGRPEPFIADFRRQGDQYEDQHADTIRFSVTSKPHERVQRKGDDLHVKGEVALSGKVHSDAHIRAQVASIRGRHLLLWGLNPFRQVVEESCVAELRVRVVGEGLGEAGALSFVAKSGNDAAAEADARREDGDESVDDEQDNDPRVVITLKHLTTEAELFLLVHPHDAVGDIRKQALSVLNLPRGSMLKLLKPLGAGKFTPWPDSTALGNHRSFHVGGTEWSRVVLTPDSGVAFLKAILNQSETSRHKAAVAKVREAPDQFARGAAIAKMVAPRVAILPEYGFRPTESVLHETLLQAGYAATKKPEGNQIRMRLEAVKAAEEEARRGPLATAAATGMANTVEAEHSESVWQRGTAAAKSFVDHFKLGPPSGWQQREMTAAMKRLTERRAAREPLCEVSFGRMGGPVTLHTKPTSTLRFYTNFEASRGEVQPGTLFVMCLSSQACSKGKARGEWDRLKYQLIPLLRDSCFRLLRAARAVLPRPLAAEGAFSQGTSQRRRDPEDGKECTMAELRARYQGQYTEAEIYAYWEHACLPVAESPAESPAEPPVPWKRLADEAFKRGECWLALCLYSRRLEDLTDSSEFEEVARVMSNRAGCFARVKEYGMSLQEARHATRLQPDWAKAWSRVGFAASMIGGEEENAEALGAYSKAVELEPLDAHVRALYRAAEKGTSPSAEAPQAAQEKGNEAVRVREWSTAVAMYTVGLAQLPPEGFNTEENQFTFLRSVLLCNRSAAFARLRNWPAAVADAQAAIEAKKDFAKAHCRLGVALLGSQHCEQAYASFARTLVMHEDCAAARKGRNECLREMLRWRSVPARARISKCLKDARRPRGSSRVFAIGDVHFDHKINENWAHCIDDSCFQEDVLIVAGDLAGTKGAVVRGLTTLKSKFRRVFYTVGHNEMWLAYGEHERFPDSIAKLHGIFEACDDLGVDICAGAVCEDVFVVPLHSWYTADFDERDPWPNPSDKMDAQARWPMDPDDQVWKYMLKLNEAFLGLPYHGTVITFSHFLPRRNLPLPMWPGFNTAKTSGCERIDDQVRGVRSKLHVFGHSHQRYFGMHDGVIYVQQPLGYSNEQLGGDDTLPLLMVYDGRSTCARPWNIMSNSPQ